MGSVGNIVHYAILNKRIDIGAIHDSEEQSDAPRCHPGTRAPVLGALKNWIDHGDKRIAWVTGFAGIGKTAIVHSIAEQCHQEGALAASFFSSSSHRRDIRTLIPTIAYQLSSNHTLATDVGKELSAFFSKNPDIFEKTLDSQTERLLQVFKKPLQRPGTTWPKVIVIDGIDEWRLEEDKGRSQKQVKQRQALQALLKLALDADFPFRILIGSRQETAIFDLMHHEASAVVTMVNLNQFLVDDTARRIDIGIFFDSKFKEIHCRHGTVGGLDTIFPGVEWPYFYEQNSLVTRAEGYFPYASSVVRFIDNGSQSPQAQLKAVLDRREQDMDWGYLLKGRQRGQSEPPPPPNPFSDLDEMYANILNSSPDPIKAVTVIQIILMQGRHMLIPAYFWNHFFESGDSDQGLSQWGLKRLLEPLRPLMDIPAADDKTTPYTFCHGTLLEFFENERRCGKLYVFSDDAYIFFAKFYWRIVERKYFSSAQSDEQAILLDHLFNLMPYFADRCLHPALMRCDTDWWTENSISRMNSRGLRLAFGNFHHYCSWYRCTPLCSRWREPILRRCKAAGWPVPDMSSLWAIYENRTNTWRDYDNFFHPPFDAVKTVLIS